MGDSVSINGEEYELDDNPSLGTVRKVQGMGNKILQNILDEEDLEDLDELDDDQEVMRIVMEKEGLEGLEEALWNQSMLLPAQTISLACDEAFSPDDLEDVGVRDFQKIKESAVDALGGHAGDFFEDVEIGMSSVQVKMAEAAEKMEEKVQEI